MFNYSNMQMPMTMNGQFPNYYQNPNQRQEIVKVNGENGARAFQMYPNSSALLLDETNPLVWLVQTDGAGYKTVSAYSITPYQSSNTADISNFEKSMSVFEKRLSRLEEELNVKPDTTDTQSK